MMLLLIMISLMYKMTLILNNLLLVILLYQNCEPKARQARANHLPSVISSIAAEALSSQQYPLSTPSSNGLQFQSRADSGTTNTLLLDIKMHLS